MRKLTKNMFKSFSLSDVTKGLFLRTRKNVFSSSMKQEPLDEAVVKKRKFNISVILHPSLKKTLGICSV